MDQARKEPFTDSYTILQEIGKGAFAVVYLCENKQKKQYAVKVMNKNQTPTQREALETEVRIMWAIKDHPNIVKLVDLFDNDTSIYMVLELITGGELFDRIIEIQSYSEQDAARIIRQILSAVDYMHQHDIVHRDLKPENLLLESKAAEADIKVADFGLSKNMKETPQLFNCAGTPGYIAPEILEAYYHKIPYGKTVDLWSTGVILYILVYGFPPFWEEDQDDMFEKIRKGDYAFPPSIPLSAEAKDIIQKLLTVDPAKRLTAHQALQHPWVAGRNVSAEPLPAAFQESLKKFNARRRFKGAINAVLALNKLKISPGSPTPKNEPRKPKIEVQMSQNDVLPALMERKNN